MGLTALNRHCVKCGAIGTMVTQYCPGPARSFFSLWGNPCHPWQQHLGQEKIHVHCPMYSGCGFHWLENIKDK